MALIECIPNVSEGRRTEVVEAMAAAVRTVEAARLLDYSADRSHNRAVFTIAGPPDAVVRAVLALYACAVPAIDLRSHAGAHPRLGAVDVVPLVPLAGATMAVCVGLAGQLGAEIARRFDIPVYLYAEAAREAGRRRLEDVRRGGFEGLAARMAEPDGAPDFGPPTPHPTAGASAVGARPPLIAFNVNLAPDRIDIARAIAARVRERGGGLPGVKALGLRLGDRGIVQVSMNLTDYARTSIAAAFDAVAREADRLGALVLESEIIGLVPAAALAGVDAAHLHLVGAAGDAFLEQVLEHRLAAAGL